MDGGEHVVPHHFFVDENGVLVVIALPGHEADEDILAQGNFAVAGGGAVGDDLAGFHVLAMLHHRALVDAGALVGTGEFDELIGILGSVGIAAHDDAIGGNRRHGAGFLGQDADAGVDAGLVFHAGADDG